jgi:hypothetical protein
MIIETTENRFYSVRETGDENLAHVWYGYEVKKLSPRQAIISGCDFAPKGKARMQMVRKAATRIVEA